MIPSTVLSRKIYPLSSLINNAEDIAIALSNPQPAIPNPLKSISFICALIQDDDFDFPFVDFNKERQCWSVETAELIVGNKVIWRKATHSPITIIRLFRQFGWNVTALIWEPITAPNKPLTKE